MSVFDYTQMTRALTRADLTRTPEPRTTMSERLWGDVAERLLDIKRTFARTLIIGIKPPDYIVQQLATAGKIDPQHMTFVSVDETEMLSVEPGTFDLVLSIGTLHMVNDVPTMLLQMRFALSPDGAMIAVCPGGETLRELRDVMMRAELELCGGATPRVHPTLDPRALSGLMQQAGFKEPVVDYDRVTIEYGALQTLYADLRAVGGTNNLTQRSRRFTRRALFKKMDEIYSARYATSDARLPATFDVLYAIGWAPV